MGGPVLPVDVLRRNAESFVGGTVWANGKVVGEIVSFEAQIEVNRVPVEIPMTWKLDGVELFNYRTGWATPPPRLPVWE